MRLEANCGSTIDVPKDHPYLSVGVFSLLEFEQNTGLEIDFLVFVFQNISTRPIYHASMAYKYGLKELAKSTFTSYMEQVDESICEEDGLEMFSWYEVPDPVAIRKLEKPTHQDLKLIIKLKYRLCYRKFVHLTNVNSYEHLEFDFLEEVIANVGLSSCLFCCCLNDKFDMVRVLVEKGAKLKEEYFPYIADIIPSRGNLEIVTYLVQSGLDIRINNDSMLISVTRHGFLELVKFLISLGANHRVENDYPLCTAAANNRIEVVKYLISIGADPRGNNDYGLKWAAERGHIEIVKYLMTFGADVRSQNDYALRNAAKLNQLDMVKFLVSQGANPRAMNDEALNRAVFNSHFEMTKYLISLGSIPNNDSGLVEASRNGKLEMVKYFVERGGDVGYRNNAAIRKASGKEKLDIMKYLVSMGADIRAKNNIIATNAHLYGDIGVIQYLQTLGITE